MSPTARKIHRWGAWLTALPLFAVLISGLLLQVKSSLPFVEPTRIVGSGIDKELTPYQVFGAVQGISPSGVVDWSDIVSMDLRPSQKAYRIRTRTGYEVQVDAATGAVLHHGPRRTGALLSLHVGAVFGDPGRYGLFLISGFLTLALWFTGTWILVRPMIRGEFHKESHLRAKKERGLA